MHVADSSQIALISQAMEASVMEHLATAKTELWRQVLVDLKELLREEYKMTMARSHSD